MVSERVALIRVVSRFAAIAIAFGGCKNAPTSSTSPASVVSAAPIASADPSSSASSPIALPSSAPSSSSDDFLGRVPAQPMSYQGAWWLDRANRDETQKPEHVLDVMGVHAGQTVADIGCGSGYFSVHLAKRVGNTGRVLATDLQPEMLALLDKKVQAAKLTNITPILATGATRSSRRRRSTSRSSSTSTTSSRIPS